VDKLSAVMALCFRRSFEQTSFDVEQETPFETMASGTDWLESEQLLLCCSKLTGSDKVLFHVTHATQHTN